MRDDTRTSIRAARPETVEIPRRELEALLALAERALRARDRARASARQRRTT